MTDTSRFPSRLAAYEAGRRAGAKEERERLAAQPQRHDDGPEPLSLEDIKAGRYSLDELIDREPEVDQLLTGEAR